MLILYYINTILYYTILYYTILHNTNCWGGLYKCVAKQREDSVFAKYRWFQNNGKSVQVFAKIQVFAK